MSPDVQSDISANAAEIGNAAIQQTIRNAEKACQHVRQRLELNNQPRITECKARLKICSDERDDLRATLRMIVKPAEDTKHRRSYYMAVAVILCFAGFSFAHLALEPFNFGWVAWSYAVALAIVGAVSTELVLEKYGNKHVVGILCVTALVASLSGIVILAILRGDILILFLKTAVSGANGDAISPEDGVMFYQSSATKLRLFFGLLAVAMELATGLAIWEARRISRDADHIQQRLVEIQEEMIFLVGRIVYLTNEPAAFEHEFWANFFRGLLCAVQRNLSQGMRIVSLILFAALFAHSALAQPPFVILGLDLSKSEVTTNPYGPQEHEKNIATLAQIIRTLPAGSEFRVVGITDQSFSRPLILFSGKVPIDRGPLGFINRIEVARTKLATQILTIGQSVKPSFPRTDVLGFFMLSSQMCQESHRSRCVLIVLSDLRNFAPPLDIESPAVVPVSSALRTVEQQRMLADLRGADVYLVGVHAIGKDVPYWDSLRRFWRAYIEKSGAHLRVFSMMRDVPDLEHISGPSTGDRR